jgi:chromosome segregation ATPase
LLAALYVPFAGAAYKCTDEKGVTHIGDTPPAGCATVMMYEVSRSGAVIRNIEPTPTPEQLKARLEEESRKKEAEKAAADQKRKDLALLSSYSNEREFDVARDRNIEPLNGRIYNSRDRLKVLDKRLKELDDEMEFYKAGKSKGKSKDGKERAAPEAPAMLVGELARLKHERETINKALGGYDREIAALKAKFDTDKKRWLALKSGAPSTPPPQPAPEAKQDVKAAAKTDPKPVKKN